MALELPADVAQPARIEVRKEIRAIPRARAAVRDRADTAIAVARCAAASSAVVLGFARGPHPAQALLVAALAWSVVRLRWGKGSALAAWADVAIAAAIMGPTGGPASHAAPFGLVAVLGAGPVLGPRFGALAGLSAAVSSAASVFLKGGFASSYHAAAWLTLFPVVGLAAGLGERIRSSGAHQRTVASERARIARDLHDGVAQALAHLRMELGTLARTSHVPGVRAEADRLSRVAERALADLRSTVLELRTRQADLVSSLRAYLEDLDGPDVPRIEFSAGVDARAAPAVEAELFRVAQEAVSNAIRHARASLVRVDLSRDGDLLRLVVADDGCGIPELRRAGVGLRAMSERAEAIGGRLQLGPRAGGGTTVCLEVIA